jgi:hypothetical protein
MAKGVKISRKSVRRVVMAKAVAQKYLDKIAHTEHRLQILYGSTEIKNLPSLLRSFRDGRVVMGSVQPLPDLGVKEAFDSITVWSSHREALASLATWFEERGYETSGIW